MMMVFASDAGIEVLRRTTTISVDGTFNSCPPPFIQVFVLMAKLPQGSQMPAVFGLLPNKMATTYTHFFRVVRGLSEDMFSGTLLCFLWCCLKFNTEFLIRSDQHHFARSWSRKKMQNRIRIVLKSMIRIRIKTFCNSNTDFQFLYTFLELPHQISCDFETAIWASVGIVLPKTKVKFLYKCYNIKSDDKLIKSLFSTKSNLFGILLSIQIFLNLPFNKNQHDQCA